MNSPPEETCTLICCCSTNWEMGCLQKTNWDFCSFTILKCVIGSLGLLEEPEVTLFFTNINKNEPQEPSIDFPQKCLKEVLGCFSAVLQAFLEPEACEQKRSAYKRTGSKWGDWQQVRSLAGQTGWGFENYQVSRGFTCTCAIRIVVGLNN